MAYIDDSLLQADTHSQCMTNVRDTVSLLDSIGLTVHPEKSVVIPTPCIVYLGFTLDSLSMTVQLTPDKAVRIIAHGQTILRKREHTIRAIAQLVGTLVACETLEHEKDAAL